MNEVIFLFAGFIAGAGFFSWLCLHYQKKNTKKERQKLQQYLDNEKELRINAEAELKALKNNSIEREKHLKESFEALASKTIRENTQIFTELASKTMDKYLTKADDNYSQRKEAIEAMLNPLKENLMRHENLMKNLQLSSSEVFGNLKKHLEVLNENQKSLEKETNALVSALKSPRVRGRWGEIGLRRVVEFSGMNDYCHFSEQVSITDENQKKLRPDMVVYLPGNKEIAVDSKVPLNAYLEAMEANKEEEREHLLKKHSQAVLRHIKDLSAKAYWSQLGKSVDFVVLYIEVEAAFGAALTYDKNLLSEALNNRIVLATPTTLITLLQTVAYSWKQHVATENAVEILHSAKELYERLAVFSDYIQKMGGSLNNVVKNYNSAVGSWENRIVPTVRKMENLGITSEKKKIAEPQHIDLNTRELNKH